MAALLGDRANQKCVIPFVPGEGKDSVWTFQVGQNMGSVRGKLDEFGISLRTLEPHGDSTRVWVYDQGSALGSTMEKVGEHYGQDVSQIRGSGEFLGAESRTAAHEAFGGVIRSYEASHQPYQGRYKAVRREVAHHHGGEAETLNEAQDELLFSLLFEATPTGVYDEPGTSHGWGSAGLGGPRVPQRSWGGGGGDDGDCHWVTIDGTHVCISNKSGTIMKGPPHLMGKKQQRNLPGMTPPPSSEKPLPGSDVEKRLSTSGVKNTEDLGGGVSETFKVQFDDGTSASSNPPTGDGVDDRITALSAAKTWRNLPIQKRY